MGVALEKRFGINQGPHVKLDIPYMHWTPRKEEINRELRKKYSDNFFYKAASSIGLGFLANMFVDSLNENEVHRSAFFEKEQALFRYNLADTDRVSYH